MRKASTVGVDLAKNYIQVHGADERGHVAFRKKLRRQNFAEFIKPFVKTNKDDAADAEAIAEASLRPNVRPVPLKTTAQLDFQALIRVRERYIKNRVQVYHEMRALLSERGIFLNKGTEALRAGVLIALSSEGSEQGLTSECRTTLADLHAELLDLDERVKVIEGRIKRATEQNDKAVRIMELDGVGLIIAAAVLAAVPDPHAFKNGRQFAAWLGLVPKHTGSGGKTENQGLSKRGNTYLRWLLVQGAQAMVRTAEKRVDNFSKWAQGLSTRKKRPLAAVAVVVCVILDYYLGGLVNGIQLAALLRSRCQAPIVLATDSAPDFQGSKDVDYVMPKEPTSLQELVKRIDARRAARVAC